MSPVGKGEIEKTVGSTVSCPMAKIGTSKKVTWADVVKDGKTKVKQIGAMAGKLRMRPRESLIQLT